jgi:hypothetical protein
LEEQERRQEQERQHQQQLLREQERRDVEKREQEQRLSAEAAILERQMQQQGANSFLNPNPPPPARHARGGSPATRSVLRDAEDAASTITQALQEGQQVLAALNGNEEVIMGGENAHLKRDTDEQVQTDTSLTLSLNESDRVTRQGRKQSKRIRKP